MKIKSWVVWSMITPLLLYIWLIISNQTLFHTLIFCFIYLIHVYMHFFILLVQEGILISSSSKRTMADDEFLNPQQVKRNIILYLHGLLQL